MPEMANSFIATGIADQLGFTGSEQASYVARFFSLAQVRGVAIMRGAIKAFNSSTATTMSGIKVAGPISSIFCCRKVTVVFPGYVRQGYYYR